MTHSVYAVQDALGSVVYVGCTTQPPNYRVSQAFSKAQCGHDRKSPYMQWLATLNLKPSWVLLDTAETAADAAVAEAKWIAAHKDSGNLLNQQTGGPGTPGWSHPNTHSPEANEKRRQALLGVKHSEERRAKEGRPSDYRRTAS